MLKNILEQQKRTSAAHSSTSSLQRFLSLL
jgi:hypothetical protein